MIELSKDDDRWRGVIFGGNPVFKGSPEYMIYESLVRRGVGLLEAEAGYGFREGVVMISPEDIAQKEMVERVFSTARASDKIGLLTNVMSGSFTINKELERIYPPNILAGLAIHASRKAGLGLTAFIKGKEFGDEEIGEMVDNLVGEIMDSISVASQE